MLAIAKSVGLVGLDGHVIQVEVDVSQGLPAFDIVGLPDTVVRESKDRVKTAIKNAGLDFPMQRITVNLAPADLPKTGPVYDLPIAVGILAATNQIPQEALATCIFTGELSLDGTIRPVNGVLSMASSLKNLNFQNFIVPFDNGQEAGLVAGIKVFALADLPTLVKYLKEKIHLDPVCNDPAQLFAQSEPTAVDFADIKGQAFAKRALEIAAAGGHNVLMLGPPGSGKTFLARGFANILPQLSLEEALQITKIYSLSGLLDRTQPLVTRRPFRAPHHLASASSLVGGGRIPKPGEVSLSHHGVLFLDELPEFSRHTLESLRQPLEDGLVTISRVQSSLTFPARFQLVAALNPCPCGYLGDEKQPCSCTSTMIHRYRSRISGPLLDRIDIQIEVPRVPFEELEDIALPESSAQIQKRVEAARLIQRQRLAGTTSTCNAFMGPRETRKHCLLSKEASQYLKNAFNRLNLSARVADRVKKLARTIADLDHKEVIEAQHLAEAVQLRSLDRDFI